MIDWNKMPKGEMIEYGSTLKTQFGELIYIYQDCACVYVKETTNIDFVGFDVLKLAKPDKQPWLLHMGGECPVPDDVKVDLLFRDGDMHEAQGCQYYEWEYGQTHSPESDIIAYRVIGEPK